MAATTATPYTSMSGRLQQPLLAALQKKGYNYLTPVQEKVLSDLPSFTSDCLVQAKTGTGKTLAFLLPTLQALISAQNVPASNVGILIISPTRELAMQIKAECDMLTAELRPRLECHTAFGGTSKERHLKQFLNGNPTVLVATPGRLNDYLNDEHVAEKFQHLRALVLDEADTMLEAGFLPAIQEILRRIPPKSTGWQGMCFSATIPDKIKPVLSKVLRSDYVSLTTVDPNEVPTIEKVDQYSIIVPNVSDTFVSLAAVLVHEQKQMPNLKAIVFGTTANGVALLHDVFRNLFGKQFKVSELHSRLSQSARTKATDEFKNASAGLMFASDVIGRGMDFPNVDLVVQVGLPISGEQYVHRVGRTARAGQSGRAIIMLTDREKYFLRVNRHLPIKPSTTDLSVTAQSIYPGIQEALRQIGDAPKAKAYQAYLGFNKTFMKNLQTDATGIVALANEYAAAMGCPEPPMVDTRVVGKMGLKGVKGLNVGHIERGTPGRGQGRGGPAPGNASSARQNGTSATGRVEKARTISGSQLPRVQRGGDQIEKPVNGTRSGRGARRGAGGRQVNGGATS